MDRRELFPILATVATLDATPQHEHHKPAAVSAASYKRQVFDDTQNRILDTLADIIMPADESSGGAHDARVSQYFDLLAAHVPAIRKGFEDGLLAMQSVAQQQFERKIDMLSRAELSALLEAISKNEGAPTTAAELFFELLKTQTVEGYRLSHIGQTDWIGYRPHPSGLYPDLTVD